MDAPTPTAQPSADELALVKKMYKSPARSLPARYTPRVGPATLASADLLMNELPNEVLVAVFHFVRGPPASGALNAARAVCRRWREIINAHVKLERPREPYTSAYLLGYLSPRGLMPFPDARKNIFELIIGVAGEAAREHLADVYAATAGFAEYFYDAVNLHNAPRIDGERDMLYVFLGSEELRVRSGFWDGLTVEDISAEAVALHPTDVARACRLGVVLSDYELGQIFDGPMCKDANHYTEWTDEQLSMAIHAEGRVLGRHSAFPWLVARGILHESDVQAWMQAALGDGDVVAREASVAAISETIAEKGWRR